MMITSGFARVNGTRLYYEVQGSGPAVVLIHGMSLDTRMWDDQFDEFAKKYRVIRYDMRGFGKSDTPDGNPYSHHEDLQALLEHLSIRSATVVGLSLGGRVAVDFTLSFPEMVSALVTVDSVLHGYQWKEGDFTFLWSTAKEKGPDAANEIWLKDPLFAPARRNKAVAEKLAEITSDYSWWHWINDNPWVPLDPPSIEQIDRITAPSLIIVGSEDLSDYQEISRILASRIPNSELRIIHGAGHMSNMEAPAEFNEILSGFLEDTLA
jgi:3-oxoadipate enol-lactonase